MSSFESRVKASRIKMGFTQKQVADYLQIRPNSYQQIEYGKSKPSYESLLKLCQYLNVSADYLLGLSDNPEINK